MGTTWEVVPLNFDIGTGRREVGQDMVVEEYDEEVEAAFPWEATPPEGPK